MIAINEALEAGDVSNTIKSLKNPNACLKTVEDDNDQVYQERLLAAKKRKIESALAKVRRLQEFFLMNKLLNFDVKVIGL